MTIVIPGMVTISLLSLFYCSMLPETGRKARMQAFERQYIAHRGFHDNRSECPENSLPAFERAIQMGYGIELDVQLTKDGVPVVFHDWDLKRAAGVDRKIRDCTLKSCKAIVCLVHPRRYRPLRQCLSWRMGVPRLSSN